MKDQHIPHSDLVAAADGELDQRRAAEVRQHLTACWTCRTQMKEIEDAITQFVHAHQQSLPIPPPDAPQAMLRARLAELAAQHPLTWRERVSDFMAQGQRLGYFGGSMAVVTLVLFVMGVIQVSRQQFRLLPDPSATPGLTLPITEAELCMAPSTPRALPVSTTRPVFDRYGIDRPQAGVYELDYLIPPELGGSDDPRNWWPQPYSAGEWNAHVKDALEDRLHELVCQNEVTLAQAQQEIATDWVAAYKKYFRTSGPLSSHRTFTKDAPWEP